MQQNPLARDRLLNALQAAEKRISQAQLLSADVFFAAITPASRPNRDISTLGVATLLGVFLLIVATFRSLRPLLLWR